MDTNLTPQPHAEVPRRLPIALLVTIAAVAQLVIIHLVGEAISPLLVCGLAVASVIVLNVAVSWWDARLSAVQHR